MAQGAGPHMPADGWLGRWTGQAFDLSTRSIVPILVLLVFSVCAGFCGLLLLSLAPGIWTFMLVRALMAAAALLPILYVVNNLMMLDGYDGISFSDLWNRFSDAAHVFLLISVFVSMIVVFLTFMVPDPPTSGDKPPAIRMSILEILVSQGMTSVMEVITLSIFLNPLWVGVIPGLGMSAAEANLTGSRMVRNMFSVWMGICFFILLSSTVMDIAPTWLEPPLMVFIIAWVYVGAREIFGGIDENGKRQASLVPAGGV